MIGTVHYMAPEQFKPGDFMRFATSGRLASFFTSF